MPVYLVEILQDGQLEEGGKEIENQREKREGNGEAGGEEEDQGEVQEEFERLMIYNTIWLVSLLFLDGKEEFEFWWKLFFTVEPIRKVYSSNSTIRMDLDSQGLNVVGTIGSSCEIGQVELDLIPS